MRKALSASLIERVLGGWPKYTLADLENKFPIRNLPDGAMVTRFAPSPTGFMHIGNLCGMLIDKKLAGQSGGVFILRIEDTDTKREVDGAIDLILKTSNTFGLSPDEGPRQDGLYGPYIQSERKDIYHGVIAELLEKGLAYPCFLTSSEMEKIRADQAAAGFATGIYGEFAKWRDMPEDEIVKRLDAGEVPSIRLYSIGDKNRRMFAKDAVRGSITFPENDEDIVLIKSNDGLPTYHFAHLVDDHFMRTTHVVRSEEWLPSLPLHIQLFNIMNWMPPIYIHTSTLDKIDEETGGQRKLSKRKDPEANMENFIEAGWPVEAIQEYLFNIINSSYEEDKMKGKVKNIWDTELKIKKIPKSGALFDFKKLEWWAKEFIATLSIEELVERVIDWANVYGNEFNKKQTADIDYLSKIFGIERDDPKRVRKDFITWKQTLEEIEYFFDAPTQDFVSSKAANKIFPAPQAGQDLDSAVLEKFLSSFDFKDSKDLWWEKIVKIASELGIKNGDAAMTIRVTLTGRTNTPDLYSIMQIMGEEKVKSRIKEKIK